MSYGMLQMKNVEVAMKTEAKEVFVGVQFSSL